MTDQTPRDLSTNQGGAEPPRLDPAEFRDKLARFNYTPEQEQEVLSLIWEVVRTCVDAGMGLDAASMIIPSLIENAFTDAAGDVEQLETLTDNEGRDL